VKQAAFLVTRGAFEGRNPVLATGLEWPDRLDTGH
jgi:hypothetical protein